MLVRYLAVLLIIIFLSNDTWAFNDDVTHRELTRRAIPASIIKTYLKKELGFSEDVREEINGIPISEWLEYGAKKGRRSRMPGL